MSERHRIRSILGMPLSQQKFIVSEPDSPRRLSPTSAMFLFHADGAQLAPILALLELAF